MFSYCYYVTFIFSNSNLARGIVLWLAYVEDFHHFETQTESEIHTTITCRIPQNKPRPLQINIWTKKEPKLFRFPINLQNDFLCRISPKNKRKILHRLVELNFLSLSYLGPDQTIKHCWSNILDLPYK